MILDTDPDKGHVLMAVYSFLTKVCALSSICLGSFFASLSCDVRMQEQLRNVVACHELPLSTLLKQITLFITNQSISHITILYYLSIHQCTTT